MGKREITKELKRELLEVTRDGYTIKYEVLESEELSSISNKRACVYNGDTVLGLTFKEFNSIKDAIKYAVKLNNVQILVMGKTIIFDKLNDTKAYYIDDELDKMIIVNI